MSIGSISLIGGLILSALTIGSNIWVTYLTKRSELKKEITLKILENSFKEYEFRTKHTIEEAVKAGRQADLYPYDYYLIHFSELAKLLDKKELTEEAIKNVVKSQKLFRKIYKEELDKSEQYLNGRQMAE